MHESKDKIQIVGTVEDSPLLKKLRKGAIALYAFNRGETFEVAQPKFEMLSHQDQGRLMEAVRQVLVALDKPNIC